jgi:hypothetical protein
MVATLHITLSKIEPSLITDGQRMTSEKKPSSNFRLVLDGTGGQDDHPSPADEELVYIDRVLRSARLLHVATRPASCVNNAYEIQFNPTTQGEGE